MTVKKTARTEANAPEPVASDDRPVEARIRAVFDGLTASEKRLAEVVIDSQGDLAAFRAGELADRAGVSAATAARFFRRLGYENYDEARRAARTERNWGSPLYELTGIGERRLAAGDFGLHIAQDLQNLARTAEMMNPAALASAIDILVAARRLWIVGFRNSAALASYARGLLVHVKADVRLVPIAGQTLAEDLVGLRPDDAILVIGFRRRPSILREILALAGEAGARSVLIADLTADRTARLATVVLRCHNRGHSLFDSYAAPMSVLNHLCSAVGLALGEEAVNRLTEIERLHERLDPLDVGPVRRPAARRATSKWADAEK
ncbi:MAG: MurR/RpiR family transcriptional regulator [Hyphomicrobiales bacterium]|nr:MurR/RpiR family transcriptional regulator [Hyphomicrobiales bacterium]